MDLKRFKHFLKGNYSSDELEEFKNKLNTDEGVKLIENLFDSFRHNEREVEDAKLASRLIDKIHSKINIEELIKEISDEHKKQEKILDKSRKPIHFKRPRKRLRRSLSVLGILAVALAIGFVINYFTDTAILSTEKVQAAFIQKSTGKGQKLTIHLPDGSKVILNSRSSITYPEVFNDSIRQVKVEGEVFFEVVHNENRPFFVHAGELTSKVLGTSFNVRYRPEDNINTIALVTGKVQVSLGEQPDQTQNYILAPGELMKLNPLKKTLTKQKFDVEKETGWKDNIIYFTDADYKEVFETLENWYGVDINFVCKTPEVAWNLTAKFENENLENVLNALALSQGIEYKLSEKNVKIIL